MSSPFYQDDQVTLYCGDMRKIIPALGLTADAIVTDPPYGETSLSWDRWPDGWLSIAAKVASQMWCFGSLRMFMKHAQEFAGWKLAKEIVWQKHNGTNAFNDRFRRVHELATHFYQEGIAWADLYKSPVFTNDATARTVQRKKGPPQWGGRDWRVIIPIRRRRATA